ncbi:alcohol dehydrogenase [Croceicoccus naphthovorans]|uniref:Alcohol dehydrogenase n=1 Tax=Croceicoccus naphthovorans TaxID=1348774 RepID=A0A0G3XJV3_9SPHN|nr:alcohol dehydrogenase [Croceicoccus naphthovorans]
MESKAAVALAKNERMIIETINVAPPQEGEVLVEIKATGLCHSDLHGMDGSWDFSTGFPGLFGHEGAGIVREIGPGVSSFKPGDHVLTFIPHCGHCPLCSTGKTNLCYASFVDFLETSRVDFDGQKLYPFLGLGTFTNFNVFREMSLVKVRDDAPFDELCYFSCGATTGMGAALHTAKVEAGSTVIVFGLGGVGLNVVQGARLAGATQIIAVDTNPAKEAIARKMGATEFVNPKTVEGDLAGHLNEISGGGADFTFEVVGNTQLMQLAFECTKIGWGKCTIVGIAPDEARLEVPPTMLVQGKSLIGSPMGGVTGSQIPAMVDLMMDGKIDVASLITDRLPIDQINEGYDKMKRGEGIRSVVMFD